MEVSYNGGYRDVNVPVGTITILLLNKQKFYIYSIPPARLCWDTRDKNTEGNSALHMYA